MIADAKSENNANVFVVDNDPEVQKTVAGLASQMAMHCQCFSSGLNFLDSVDDETAGCVVSEVRIADIGGLQLQRRVAATGNALPFVFLTAHATVPLAVRAVKEGAIDFLQKPSEDQTLWEAIQRASRWDRRRRRFEGQRRRFERLCSSLTDRQKAILQMVTDGKPNREIALKEGISVRTVEMHRSRLLHIFGASNLQGLVRVGMLIRCTHWPACQCNGSVDGEGHSDAVEADGSWF